MTGAPPVTPPVALTIAGSDSGGGAGIQADLKTFAAFRVHGTSAITALTAQNTRGVQGIQPVPAEFVDSQITSVLSDFRVEAVKTGMLGNADIVEVVAKRAAAGDLPNLVVDPVMVAASGDRLLDPEAEHAYLELLFPQALVVTPNLPEAMALTGGRISGVEQMSAAARRLAGEGREGPRYVVVKGGHLAGDQEAVDLVFDGKRVWELRGRRMGTSNLHGTGCTFASAIAAGLARGRGPARALREAKEYLGAALEAGAEWKLGHGRGPVDHFPRRRPR